MKYIKWIFLAILDLAFNCIAYLTNPFVLLFADEVGNLPHIFYRPSFGSHHWDNFVGWKFRWMEHEKERCMLAFRFNPFQ